MIKFHPGKDYPFDLDWYGSPALTLEPRFVTTEKNNNESGWVIKGEIEDVDYLEGNPGWVNKFEASHPDYGILQGDFEECIEAESREAFDHFWSHHQPEEWNYWDI